MTLFSYKSHQKLSRQREVLISRYAKARLNHRPSEKIGRRLQNSTTRLLRIENGEAA